MITSVFTQEVLGASSGTMYSLWPNWTGSWQDILNSRKVVLKSLSVSLLASCASGAGAVDGTLGIYLYPALLKSGTTEDTISRFLHFRLYKKDEYPVMNRPMLSTVNVADLPATAGRQYYIYMVQNNVRNTAASAGTYACLYCTIGGATRYLNTTFVVPSAANAENETTYPMALTDANTAVGAFNDGVASHGYSISYAHVDSSAAPNLVTLDRSVKLDMVLPVGQYLAVKKVTATGTTLAGSVTGVLEWEPPHEYEYPDVILPAPRPSTDLWDILRIPGLPDVIR